MNIEPDVEYSYIGAYEDSGQVQLDIEGIGTLYLYESGVLVLRDHAPDGETLN